MSTAVQQRANKENAQHSTGPRTAEGKQRSAQNSLKHGLCAQDPLIPGEDPDAFAKHFCEIELDLQPASAIESHLVEQIADISWRLKRLSRIEAAVITAFYDATAEQPLNQGKRPRPNRPRHHGLSSNPRRKPGPDQQFGGPKVTPSSNKHHEPPHPQLPRTQSAPKSLTEPRTQVTGRATKTPSMATKPSRITGPENLSEYTRHRMPPTPGQDTRSSRASAAVTGCCSSRSPTSNAARPSTSAALDPCCCSSRTAGAACFLLSFSPCSLVISG